MKTNDPIFCMFFGFQGKTKQENKRVDYSIGQTKQPELLRWRVHQRASMHGDLRHARRIILEVVPTCARLLDE